MADLHNYIWHRMVLVHFRAYVHIWYHHDIMLYMYLTDTGALERMSTWTDELRLCECMYKGSTYNALYHCIKVNIYERIWPHMRQMVGRELGESLVAKLVSSTSWENLRPATSRGSTTGAKQLLPWIATPPPTILRSSPSRICSWSMLSVQDYCNISYKISKCKKYFWTTIIQQFSGIWGKMRWNNMPSWALSRWGLIFNRTLNTILLRIRELHLKRVFAGVLFR